MRLFICEKPSQAKDVANVLGSAKRSDGFFQVGNDQVTWCIGHLLENAAPHDYDPAYKKWTLEQLPIVPDKWQYNVVKSKSKQYAVVKRLLKKSRHVVIATDAAREGEMIAREVLDFNDWSGKLERLWFSALNEKTISRALATIRPSVETQGLYQAALARSYADWLVGLNLTRAMTVISRERGNDTLLSIGRVQTPTLALINQRDQSIANFTPDDFYAALLAFEGPSFQAHWKPSDEEKQSYGDDQGRCLDRDYVQSIVDKTAARLAYINHVTVSRKREYAPRPFSLSGLQKICSRDFKYGVKRTDDIVQTLYERHKLISYPRTNCEYLPEDEFDNRHTLVEQISTHFDIDEKQLAGASFDHDLKSKVWDDTKLTDHHAIIPIENTSVVMTDLSDAELKVYRLIALRYLSQFCPPAEQDETSVLLDCEGHQFEAKGSVILCRTWKNFLRTNSMAKAAELPRISKGEQHEVVSNELITKKTTPPKHFTEGTLIDAMLNVQKFVEDKEATKILKENEGIGTEATRSEIIETLKKRDYVTVKKGVVRATQLGVALINQVPPDLADPVTTALMERQLNLIEQGELELDTYLSSMVQFVEMMLKQIRD